MDSKTLAFIEINQGKKYGTIDKQLLQEAYADSDDFWEAVSQLVSINADSVQEAIAKAIASCAILAQICYKQSDALLDQALAEVAESEADARAADIVESRE